MRSEEHDPPGSVLASSSLERMAFRFAAFREYGWTRATSIVCRRAHAVLQFSAVADRTRSLSIILWHP